VTTYNRSNTTQTILLEQVDMCEMTALTNKRHTTYLAFSTLSLSRQATIRVKYVIVYT